MRTKTHTVPLLLFFLCCLKKLSAERMRRWASWQVAFLIPAGAQGGAAIAAETPLQPLALPTGPATPGPGPTARRDNVPEATQSLNFFQPVGAMAIGENAMAAALQAAMDAIASRPVQGANEQLPEVLEHDACSLSGG